MIPQKVCAVCGLVTAEDLEGGLCASCLEEEEEIQKLLRRAEEAEQELEECLEEIVKLRAHIEWLERTMENLKAENEALKEQIGKLEKLR